MIPIYWKLFSEINGLVFVKPRAVRRSWFFVILLWFCYVISSSLKVRRNQLPRWARIMGNVGQTCTQSDDCIGQKKSNWDKSENRDPGMTHHYYTNVYSNICGDNTHTRSCSVSAEVLCRVVVRTQRRSFVRRCMLSGCGCLFMKCIHAEMDTSAKHTYVHAAFAKRFVCWGQVHVV